MKRINISFSKKATIRLIVMLMMLWAVVFALLDTSLSLKLYADDDAKPEPPLPTVEPVTYTPNLMLQNISLSGDWIWVQNILLNAGTSFHSIYHPATAIYQAKTADIEVTVLQADPVYQVPTIADIKYFSGIKLSNVPLPASFAWVNPSKSLTVGSNKEMVTFTPVDSINYKTITIDVSFNVTRGTPTPVIPSFEAQYFDGITLSNLVLPSGFQWHNPYTALSVGTREYQAKFTPSDTDFFEETNFAISVTITPASYVPSELPKIADFNYFVGTLKDVPLPSGWTWEKPNTQIFAGEKSYVIIYTPQSSNFEPYHYTVNFTVNKADPPIPTLEPIDFYEGLVLKDVPLPNGWVWAEFSIFLSGGTHSYRAIYTSTSNNYRSMHADLTIQVEKIDPPIPSSQIRVPYKKGAKLSSVALPEGWRWQNPDTIIKRFGNKHVAVYDGDENYNPQTLTFNISTLNVLLLTLILSIIGGVIILLIVIIIAIKIFKKVHSNDPEDIFHLNY